MFLRMINVGRRKSKKKKLTKEQIDAELAFKQMQAKLDNLPKFARTPRPKDLALRNLPKLETPVGRTNTKHLKSLNPNESTDSFGEQGTVRPKLMYTGTKMKGVAVLHKSNGVPVFSDEEIKDIGKMRR